MCGYICVPVCFVYFQEVVHGVDASQIRGLGFDATCSLVVVDKQFQPLAVNCEGRAPHKTWYYCVCFTTAGRELPMSSKSQVVGLTLGDGDDTNSFLQEDFFPWFYCFNFTAKLNLRWELLTVWLNIWHHKITFIHLDSEKLLLKEIYAHFSFLHIFFSFRLYWSWLL